MPATPRKTGTYYDRKSAERREYQQAYYARNKEQLARNRELSNHFDPEAHAKYLDYQKGYYQRRKAARAPKDP